MYQSKSTHLNYDHSLKDLLVRFDDFVNDFVDSQLLACTDFTGRDRVISNLSINQLPKVTFNLCPKSLHKLISELKRQQIIQVQPDLLPEDVSHF